MTNKKLLSVVAFLVVCISSTLAAMSCPVCGMAVTESDVFRLRGGQRLLFCGMGHAPVFLSSPKKYLTAPSMVTNKTATPTTNGDGEDMHAGHGSGGMMMMTDAPVETDAAPHHRRTMEMGGGDSGIVGNSDGDLCPVCLRASQPGFGVATSPGEQAVHTCSHAHADAVYDDITAYAHDHSMTPDDDSNELCSGEGSVMQNGFVFSSDICTRLLFESWDLNTRVKYGFACVGIFLLSAAVELLSMFRRVVVRLGTEKTTKDAPSAPVPYRLFASALHAVTSLLAYFLMLVAMTYDAALFIMIIAGFAVGYYFFGPLSGGKLGTAGGSQVVANIDEPTCAC